MSLMDSDFTQKLSQFLFNIIFEDCLCLQPLSQKTAKLILVSFCTSLVYIILTVTVPAPAFSGLYTWTKNAYRHVALHIMSSFLCYSDFYMSLGML
jgi:hypothetical protein